MSENRSALLVRFDSREILEALSHEERGKLFLILLDYAENGIVPEELEAATRMAFLAFRHDIDYDAKKWKEKHLARVQAGRAGGLQKAANASKSSNASVCLANLASTSTSTSTNTNNSTNTSTNTNILSEDKQKKTRKRFVAPTIEEVEKYCRERGNSIDAQQFCDFYEARGWKLGNNRMMVNWQACIRTWEKNANGGKYANSNGREIYSDGQRAQYDIGL